MPFSVYHVKGFVMLVILITGDVYLPHLPKRLGKVTIFPFLVNKYLGGDTVRLCKYPVSLQAFVH